MTRHSEITHPTRKPLVIEAIEQGQSNAPVAL